MKQQMKDKHRISMNKQINQVVRESHSQDLTWGQVDEINNDQDYIHILRSYTELNRGEKNTTKGRI